MKRVYLKAYTKINLGDDLFVRIICERYPKVQFYLNVSKDEDEAFETIKNLTLLNRAHLRGMIVNRFLKIGQKLDWKKNVWFDAQVYIGGSIFMQPQDWYEGSEYEKNVYKFRLNEEIPYFILGANFGPYEDERFVEFHKELFLTQLKDLCFRDQWSYHLFKEIPQVRYAPDIVFTNQIPKKEKKNLVVISCISNNGRIGIPPFDNAQYRKKMAQICDAYVQMGKEVCLLSMCKEEGDEDACIKIRDACKEKVNTVFYQGNLDEVLELFAQAEYVIASRFHAMILAWVTQTPVFPVCYNNKAEQAIASYGFLGKSVHIQNFCDVDFETIDANRKQKYVFDVEHLKQEAEKQFEMLDKFLK